VLKSKITLRNQAFFFIAIVLQIFLVTEMCSADTFYVSNSGSNSNPGTFEQPFLSIQYGINTVAANDTLLIFNGTYSGTDNRNLDFNGKDIALCSYGENASFCVIDGGGEDGFLFHTGESSAASIENLTIRNCSTGIIIGNPDGDSPSSPAILNCIVELNATGVVVSDFASVPVITDCRILYNGTGLYYTDHVLGQTVQSCYISHNTGNGISLNDPWGNPSLEFIDCTIELNGNSGFSLAQVEYSHVSFTDSFLTNNLGWGISAHNTESNYISISGGRVANNQSGGIKAFIDGLTVSDCEISGNQGTGIGIGNFVFFPIINNCTIFNNTGDGIIIAGSINKKLPGGPRSYGGEILGCEIYANGGAGIHFSSPMHYPLDITECLIRDNSTGGVFINSSYGYDARVTIAGTTITNCPYGVYIDTDIPCYFNNSIIAFNAGESIVTVNFDELDFNCMNIYGNIAGDWINALAPFEEINNNISADPEFCMAGGLDPYSLSDSSPCAPSNPICGQIGARGVGCSVSAIEGGSPGNYPFTYSLHQAYPNPFNPSTTLSFDLPHNEWASLMIYDVSGRLIDVLFDGWLASGSHEMTWQPRQQASGVYFARLATNEFSEVVRLMLLK
jgi:Right handed beta helix region